MKKKNVLIGAGALLLALAVIFSVLGPVAVFANTDWTVSSDTEIFWVKNADSEMAYGELAAQVGLFSSELAEKVTGNALPVSYGALADAGKSDIILILDSASGIARQGFTLQPQGKAVQITASDADGLFYGCRELIGQLVLEGKATGTAEAPDVLERAVSLDCGRKYYTVDWIKELIREMSWANMNALVLHFSEEMGLGLESKTYPWLAGRDGTLCTQADLGEDYDSRYLTQDEVREIAAYAKRYHVELIPSFDSPGHMNYIVKKYNAHYGVDGLEGIGNYYHYDGKTAIVQGSRNKEYSRGIDISNETAVEFTRSLITEYAAFFRELGCTKFDIGGDELLGWGSAVVSTSKASRWQQLDHWKEYAIQRTGNSKAVAYDGFMLYMNDLYDLVSGLGYTSVRMWNDDAFRSADTGWNRAVELNENIEILYWTPTANSSKNSVWTYLNAGHQAYNYLNAYNYYALGVANYQKQNQEAIYSSWSPYVFDPNSSTLGSGRNPSLGNPNILGSAYCIWCDNPAAKDEATVMADVLPMLRAHGAKAWDALAHESVTYADYAANRTKLGSAPAGEIAAPEIYLVADTSKLEAAVAAYGEFDPRQYTAGSFGAYTEAVEAGKAVLAREKPLQADVDAAAAAIQTARDGLVEFRNCLISAVFKSTRVKAGRAAILTVNVSDDVSVDHLELFDSNGDEVRILRCARNSDGSITVTFTAPEHTGTCTYTVYAVLADGSRAEDLLRVALKVK